ncbi:MAG: sigma-E factor negative regulatory protein [Cocleimonas sp.]|nr:sigma-E factor negative regulatory protein [Cocleimonas sp.]
MSNSKKESNGVDQQVSLTEHLSALFDDEAGPFEQRRVLDELKGNDKLCKSLSHFALIGETMRSRTSVAVADDNFLAGIHAHIDAEPAYNKVQFEENIISSTNDATNLVAKKQRSWLRPVGGFALAASVAAISVIGIQNYQQADQSTGTIVMTQDVKVVKPSQVATVVEGAASKMNARHEYRQANTHARSFLKRYVDSHMEYASTSTFVPSVRVIAYADYK